MLALDPRYNAGEGDYVLVARETDPDLAERLAERLRSRIAERSFRYGEIEVRVTCSLGFASYPLPRNRPGLLIETHMLKDYATRVEATRLMLVHTLDWLADRPAELRQVVAAADARSCELAVLPPHKEGPLARECAEAVARASGRSCAVVAARAAALLAVEMKAVMPVRSGCSLSASAESRAPAT